MRGANLWNAHMERIRLQGADLRGANLQGAKLIGADLSAQKLDNNNLPPKLDLMKEIKSGRIVRDKDGNYWKRTDLRGADLRGADLRGACMKDCIISDDGELLKNADFRGVRSDLSYAIKEELQQFKSEGKTSTKLVSKIKKIVVMNNNNGKEDWKELTGTDLATFWESIGDKCVDVTLKDDINELLMWVPEENFDTTTGGSEDTSGSDTPAPASQPRA